jgi:hypothetical protein
MQVMDVSGTRPFVEVVDVLGDEKKIRTSPSLFEPCQCDVRGIGQDRRVLQRLAPMIVKRMNELRIFPEGLGASDLLDAMSVPQTARASKGR